ISADADLSVVNIHKLHGEVPVKAGERFRLSVPYVRPETIDPHPPRQPDDQEIDHRLDETIKWWRGWADPCTLQGVHVPAALRSAIVLKALTNAPTGAIAAAPTTSLPEVIGGDRNWDYRFSWIRDSQFTVRSLGQLGFHAEADGFRRFIERTAAGAPAELQIMYGLDGRRRLTEVEIPLEGYRGSSPVRIGNAASEQTQLDVYGELLDLAWRWHTFGRSPDADYWRFLMRMVDIAAERWDSPDRGLLEMRAKPRHFVHSKAMCWAALDRGIRISEDSDLVAPLDRWRKARDHIHDEVMAKGVDPKRGVFVQSFGATDLDAALLLLPSVDFVPYDDEVMVATTDAIAEELDDGGLVRRYNAEDGLGGREGVFVAGTFWLAECYAYQKRFDLAQAAFDRAAATANDLGLFPEEYNPQSRQALGNFPQGLSHLSHIAAAVALSTRPDNA
ncbi:MAG: glycoside hydrolase family 15 protein, partial [Acidimicrobiales bacterium]